MAENPRTKKNVDRKAWIQVVKQYQQSDNWTSTRQILNSVVPFIVILIGMYYAMEISYWLTLGLGVINAGFITRIFIIQHDCGHTSFYKSQKANDIVGSIFGVITFTPYYLWRRNHAKHHATSGNLDSRGVGDVYTMTVTEYQDKSNWEKFKYRFYRHPITLFVIGPVAVFFIGHRFTMETKKTDKAERASVHYTNLALAVLITGFGLLIGFKELALLIVPMYIITFSGGIYLFYVQHQFEQTYWRKKPEWDYFEAAMQGASYFKLPKLLQWFSGNIGFHHIHHLSPKIPNYLLETAYNENEILRGSNTLTLRSSLKSISLKLWDQKLGRLISFREYRILYPPAAI